MQGLGKVRCQQKGREPGESRTSGKLLSLPKDAQRVKVLSRLTLNSVPGTGIHVVEGEH